MSISSKVISVIMLSMIIGMMVSKLIVRESAELYWLKRTRPQASIDNLVLIVVSIINSNLLLIIAGVSFIISGISNRTLIMHWILVMFLVALWPCSTYNTTASANLTNAIILIVCIDIISIINIILVKDSIGEGIWYYFLYQSIISMLIFIIISIDMVYLVGILYYYKLGSGIGGYYIPNLYNYIISSNVVLLIYIGITNIILMYNPIYILSNLSSYSSSLNTLNTLNTYSSNLLGSDMVIEYDVIMLNMIIVSYIISLWIYNGYLFINKWLYLISISTVILSNIYNIFIYIDLSHSVSYSLVYHLFYFTLTYILMWFTLVLTLLISLSINTASPASPSSH